MSKRRSRWVAAIASAAIGLGVAAHLLVHPPATAPPAATPAVATATVRYGDYDVVLTETGSVGAPTGTTTQVAFPIAGILRSIDVRVGQRVEAGTLLAELRTRKLALDARQASAEAAAAEANYAGGAVPQARLQAARADAQAVRERVAVDRDRVLREERLFRAGVAALKTVESARARLASDRAAAVVARANARAAASQGKALAAHVAAAQARSAAARQLLSQAKLYAPTPGVVTAIFKRPGEAADMTEPVLAIGPPQSEATLAVPAVDARQIHPADPVSLHVDGLPRSRGRVTAIVPAVDPQTQSATIVVDGVPRGAVAGMSVQADITVAHVHGLLIPQSAIVEDPESGSTLVFVSHSQPHEPAKFAAVKVDVVHENGTVADVRSGLHPGERIAAQGAFSLLAPREGN
jgi:HlyD family secretion protein